MEDKNIIRAEGDNGVAAEVATPEVAEEVKTEEVPAETVTPKVAEGSVVTTEVASDEAKA